MARKEVTQYFDDLDNSPLAEDEVRVVRFSLEGTDYVIDLSPDNALQMRADFDKYVRAGRRDTDTPRRRRGTSTAPSAADRELNRARRQWARQNGFQVAERGKLSDEIIKAYDEAHGRI